MKKIVLAVSLLVSAASAIAQQWPTVNPEARPGTRWWWLGSAVDSAGIDWNLRQYAQAGLGSVEITPIYGVQNNDANNLPFLSDAWMKALAQVQATAAQTGILVDMNQGTGWPFGGPEIDLNTEAACKAHFVIDTVATGAISSKEADPREQKTARFVCETRRPLDSANDLVIKLYESRTRQAVKRAAPGGEGYVLDHFDKNVVRKYLNKFSNAFDSHKATYPHNFFNDSYEVYGANWTPTLLDEFEKRRGYKLQDKFPELLGIVNDGNAVLSDYRETVAELLLENFTGQWVDWAHQRGVQIRNQAHGSPANLIDVYGAVDVPEIEGFGLSDFGIKGLRTDPGFTRRNDSDVSMLKYASSAAHVTGKPLTSSETFTWLTEHFRTSLSQMKPDIDLMFTCGVNHMFFHGTTYTPLGEEWPGWKFYASVDMSPTNSIWRDARYFMEYMTRCQSFLQMGQPDNDFLVYLPIRDMWRQRLTPGERGLMMTFDIHSMAKKAPDFIRSIMEIDSLGYDCDYISDNYLMGTSVGSDGSLTTAAGTRYRGLIIPGSGNLTPELRSHIDQLKRQGANIIWGIDDKAIEAATSAEPLRTEAGMRVIRRSNPTGHHYFMSNLSPHDIDMWLPLTVDYKDAAWFDPMTGEIYRAEMKDGKIRFNFRSGQSRILQTYNRHMPALADKVAKPSHPMEINLTDNPWQLSFIESTPAINSNIKLDRIKPWTALGNKELDSMMGTGVYSTTFNLKKNDIDGDWYIELGDVRESARVYINDHFVGCAWAAPFALECSKYLRKGKNTLRIEVTNLPANRIADLDRRGIKWRKFNEINVVDINYKKTTYENWETVPSGLNSTVKLIRK